MFMRSRHSLIHHLLMMMQTQCHLLRQLIHLLMVNSLRHHLLQTPRHLLVVVLAPLRHHLLMVGLEARQLIQLQYFQL